MDESRDTSGRERRTKVHMDVTGERSACLVGASGWRGRHCPAAILQPHLSADQMGGESEGPSSRLTHTTWWNLVDLSLNSSSAPHLLSDLGQDLVSASVKWD